MGGAYLGLFFTSLAALMLEIILTRIFSVATWYYYAFFAISVAMFGLTVGALVVYRWREFFAEDRLYERLCLFAVLFGFLVDLSLLMFLSMPFEPRLTPYGILSTAAVYLAISAPFVCAGVIICLCLTRFSKKIGFIYAADLAGAGVGAFMVFPVLNAMDAPTGVFLVGALASLGGLFFSGAAGGGKLKTLGIVSKASFVILTAVMFANFFYHPVRVKWVKAYVDAPEIETWNSFSRIAVYPFKLVKTPYSWGLSREYRHDRIIGERMINIDGVSETVMTLYDGKPEDVRHLKYDVTHIAHYLRNNAKVFIIGVGGGRDILAAKVFGQKKIVGAEINDRILAMVNIFFGDLTGHLDKLPGVTIINDEARSAITRMDEKFDIIQASCIATWSATTAGAFSLAENSIYTVEAWKIFMDHLTPGGVLSFNRWYSPDYPAQLLRMTSLAVRTLKNEGVKEPGRHIFIVRNEILNDRMPSATILVSKKPFSDADLKKLADATESLKFKTIYSPAGYQNPLFREIIANADSPAFYESTEVDLSPSTDDRPFFFYMLRLRDIVSGREFKFDEQSFNLKGIMMLFILMIVSVALSVIFIFGPLLVPSGGKGKIARTGLPLLGGAAGLVFFASIGFGYILVEIAELQRLVIFLGHPIYSITVVIFAMLLASGAGAAASSLWTKENRLRSTHIAFAMAAILAVLLFVDLMQPGILSVFERNGVYARIGVSLLFLLPLGFFMGFPFPFGMSLADSRYREHAPWFWAVNGATSVVSSVLSVCISITSGFTATLTAGLAFYVLAAVSLLVFYSVNRDMRFHQ